MSPTIHSTLLQKFRDRFDERKVNRPFDTSQPIPATENPDLGLLRRKNVQNAQKRMKIAAIRTIGRVREEDEVKITHSKDVKIFLKQFQKCFQKMINIWATVC